MPRTSSKNKTIRKTESKELFSLILWNDDVNTFDTVIDALVDICEHEEIQAEQCATIAHSTGKCNVKSGEEFEILNQMKKLFDKRLITTSIE